MTYDYCVNGDGDTAWDCSCRSPECRKRHLSGFFHLPVEVQARYLALLEDWFVAEHRDEVEALKRRIEAWGWRNRPEGDSRRSKLNHRSGSRNTATGHRPGRQSHPLG